MSEGVWKLQGTGALARRVGPLDRIGGSEGKLEEVGGEISGRIEVLGAPVGGSSVKLWAWM